MDQISEDMHAALRPLLAAGERVSSAVSGVGCTLVLTDRRLLVVRDGANFRPRTGIQTWPLDRTLGLRLKPSSRGTGQLIIAHDGQLASVFLTGRHVEEARSMVAETRQRILAAG